MNEMKKMLGEILGAVKSLEQRISKLESADTSAPGGGTSKDGLEAKKLSLKEFIIDKEPSNGVQMTLVIAYYLETYDGVSPFNTADLERAFRAARETVPTNLNDKANMCVKNGYLMEEKEKKDSLKAWVVTRTGEEVVLKGFNKRA